MEFMFSLIVGELCFFTINEKSGRIVLSNEKLFLLAFLPRLDEGTLNWERWGRVRGKPKSSETGRF